MKLNQKGFTLIELLVVISIIGTLSALIVNNLNDSRVRARDSNRKQNLTQLKTALRLYYNDYQTYPAGTNSDTLNACGEDGTDICSDTFTVGPADADTVYMKTLPEFERYTQTDEGDGFIITVILENASDSDIIPSQTNCSIPSDSGMTEYLTTEYAVCTD